MAFGKVMQYFFPELLGIVSGLEKPFSLGGTNALFDSFRIVERGKPAKIIQAAEAPREVLEPFVKERGSVFGLDLKKINIMGNLLILDQTYQKTILYWN